MTQRDKLSMTMMWTLAIALAIGISGVIGFYRGHAMIVGIPNVEQPFWEMMTDGVQQAALMPHVIFQAGIIATWLWGGAIGLTALAGCFAAFAILDIKPDAQTNMNTQYSHTTNNTGLGFRVLSSFVCIGVCILEIGWLIGRHESLATSPVTTINTMTTSVFADWTTHTQITAGLDILAMIASCLWLIAAIRLKTWRWLSLLTIAVAAISLAITYVGSSTSSSILLSTQTNRPYVSITSSIPNTTTNTTTQTRQGLIIVTTATHLTLLTETGQLYMISSSGAELEVHGKTNIRQHITEILSTE